MEMISTNQYEVKRLCDSLGLDGRFLIKMTMMQTSDTLSVVDLGEGFCGINKISMVFVVKKLFFSVQKFAVSDPSYMDENPQMESGIPDQGAETHPVTT